MDRNGRQIAQGAVQAVVVVPGDDLRDGVLRLGKRGQLLFVQRLTDRANDAFDKGVLLGGVRPDPMMADAVHG